jgi:hypothetical protein
MTLDAEDHDVMEAGWNANVHARILYLATRPAPEFQYVNVTKVTISEVTRPKDG